MPRIRRATATQPAGSMPRRPALGSEIQDDVDAPPFGPFRDPRDERSLLVVPSRPGAQRKAQVDLLFRSRRDQGGRPRLAYQLDRRRPHAASPRVEQDHLPGSQVRHVDQVLVRREVHLGDRRRFLEREVLRDPHRHPRGDAHPFRVPAPRQQGAHPVPRRPSLARGPDVNHLSSHHGWRGGERRGHVRGMGAGDRVCALLPGAGTRNR